MLDAEAKWIRRVILTLPNDALSPLLSIGSGDLETRTEKQPWIDGEVFQPLRERGVHILHHEMRPGIGIDIAGDLLDPSFSQILGSLGIRSILCANVLEHLQVREPVLRIILSLLPIGGFLVATVPRAFPYHPDPIDTMYRPTVEELAADLAPLELVEGEVVACESVLRYLARSPNKGAAFRKGVANLRAGRGEARSTSPSAPWRDRLTQATRGTEVTCGLFRKAR